MDSLCDLLSQDLFQFLVFFLCSLFLRNIFDSQNFEHCLCSINSFSPPCFPVAVLVHPHICLCCFLCCCLGLSETGMDFPVLPLQASICSPACPALEPGSLCCSFHLYHVLMLLKIAEKQTSVLGLNKPEPEVL